MELSAQLTRTESEVSATACTPTGGIMGVEVSGMGVGNLSKRWNKSSSDGSEGSAVIHVCMWHVRIISSHVADERRTNQMKENGVREETRDITEEHWVLDSKRQKVRNTIEWISWTHPIFHLNTVLRTALVMLNLWLPKHDLRMKYELDTMRFTQ